MIKKPILRTAATCLALLATGCHRHGMEDHEGWILMIGIILLPLIGFIIYRSN